MKYVLVIAFAVLASCKQESVPTPVPTEISAFSVGQPIFTQVRDQLDYSTMEKVTGRDNVIIWMIKFRGNSNKIYATSARGELLYDRQMTNDKDGTIDITKNGETVRLTFLNGTRTISDNSRNFRTATLDYHGGSGFCQRETGEKFSDCFAAECDEFCDSFISCIALATQASIPIMIGIACSCNA